MLTHLDLFSGIGGFALACEWAGIETIGFVEIDKYCQKVLRKHWPDVPIVEDIRDVEKIKEIVANAQEAMCQQPRNTQTGRSRFANDSRNGESRHCGESQSSAILITAGFPCQPFSVAGKRGGEKDDRYLWPETLTVIKAVKPKWVLLENVTGIINLALDTVLSDLEGAGYSTETLIIPACAVNAWHRRDRVWIVCHSSSNGLNDSQTREGVKPRNQRGEEGQNKVCQPQRTSSLWSQDATDSRSPEPGGLSGKQRQENTEIRHSSWWAVEPKLGRVAHGIPNRVDRLKCLGNAIVPQVTYEILKAIVGLEIE